MKPKMAEHRRALIRRWAIALLTAFGGIFVPPTTPLALAAPSDSFTVTFRPRDSYPPVPITDLNALPGAEGQLFLEWSAPNENDSPVLPSGPVAGYIIRIATYSADSVGSTTTWWNQAQDVIGEPAPSVPGVRDSLLLINLTPGVTYWASIKSIDEQGLESPIDTKTGIPGQQANARVFQGDIPDTPTNFVGTALSTDTVRWSWDLSAGATFYRLYTFPADAFVLETDISSATESGFGPNQAITRQLRAGDVSGLSPPTVPETVYTLANPPTGISVLQIGATYAALTWGANGNPGGTRYRLERSLDGVSFAGVSTVTTLGTQSSGLTPLTTYYYRVRAINGDDIATAPTVVISTITGAAIDIVAPSMPLGFKGSLDPTGTAFTLLWEPVTLNEDGTPLTDLAGYHVYRRNTLDGTETRITPVPLVIPVFADLVNNQTFFYSVRAVDIAGNESDDSLFADSSPALNVIYLDADGLSSVTMPTTINDLLRSAHNKYNVPLNLTLIEEPVSASGEVIRTVRFVLTRGDTGAQVTDLAFDQPLATVGVGYNLVNGQLAKGSPSIAAAPTMSAASPNDLVLYWHNGITWVKIGGTVDLARQAVKTLTSFLGSYQLRVEAKTSSINLGKENVYPRLFTPNGDGLNDRVFFIIENPNNVTVEGEIVDIEGRTVATLTAPQSGPGIGTTLSWDGKDSAGTVVPGGVYIYRIKGEGKTFTGTVGVAR